MSELRADVIVVAAGASGLPAALEAARAGASVLVFEKGATTGGTGSMGMGPFGVESRMQKLKQMGPTRDEAFKQFMDYTHWRVDARLVRAYIDKAATTIDWLEDLGVQFMEPAAYFPGGNFTWHIVRPESGIMGPQSSATMTRILTERCKEAGVKFLLRSPVKKLRREPVPGGRVVGVVAEDPSGDLIEADAKAVVVATGGFGDNPDMIKKFTGYVWGQDMWSFRIPGMEGDGIRMAWEVGAARTEMTMEMIFGLPGEVDPELHETFRQPHLMVNLQGQRFLDEGIMPNTTFTGNAIAQQKARTGFLLFDSSIKRHMEADNGFDTIHVPFPFTKVGDVDHLIAEARAAGYGEVYVADSLAELADEDRHRRRRACRHRRGVQRVLRPGLRPGVQQAAQTAAASGGTAFLRRPAPAQRLREPGGHQDQRADRGARQGVERDPRPVRSGHRRQRHLRRLLRVHPARQHDGLRAQQRPHRRGARGGVRGVAGRVSFRRFVCGNYRTCNHCTRTVEWAH